MSMIYHVLLLVLINTCVLEVTAQGGSNTRKIFVGGLSFDTAEDSMLRYFSRYGKVQIVTLVRDPATGRSRGFGFVMFGNPNSVNKVLQNKDHFLDGRIINIRRVKSKDVNDRLVENT